MTTPDIDEARRELGLSDGEVAQMLGITPKRATQTFSDWRCGRRHMDDARARLLRAYLDGYRPVDWPRKTDG